jgi:hypothetical protein
MNMFICCLLQGWQHWSTDGLAEGSHCLPGLQCTFLSLLYMYVRTSTQKVYNQWGTVQLLTTLHDISLTICDFDMKMFWVSSGSETTFWCDAWAWLKLEWLFSWAAYSVSASQEILRILWNPKVYIRVHKNPVPTRVLSQRDPVHKVQPYFR